MEKITMEAVEACLKSLGITYELSQAQALVTFCETLLKWNATYNLTTITDASSVLTLHVADSLTLVPKMKEFAPAAKRVFFLESRLNIADLLTVALKNGYGLLKTKRQTHHEW